MREDLMGLNRRLLGWAATVAVSGLLLFGGAGRWDLPWFRARLGTFAVGLLVVALVLVIDPDLVHERRRPGPGGKDRITLIVLRLFALASLIVAVLDAGREDWSPPFPAAVHLLGLSMFAGGHLLTIWSMRENRFFSSVVRIQSERGHHVIRSGPYAYIRHPGYAGMMVTFPGVALTLGSFWALIPAGLYALTVMRRMLVVDRFLRLNLEGHVDYRSVCRTRLMPYVW
jgi:protein-S-isoprenylcysteine O-methyltransferase Ste14